MFGYSILVQTVSVAPTSSFAPAGSCPAMATEADACEGNPSPGDWPLTPHPDGGYIFTANLKTKEPAHKWTMAGVALLADISG